MKKIKKKDAVNNAVADSLAQRAAGCARLGNYREAENLLMEGLEIYKDSYNANYLLGVLYAQAGLHKKGVPYVEYAMKLEPKNSAAYNDGGVIYHAIGDTDKALETFKKCLSLNKNFPEAHNNLGVSYQAKGDYQKARDCYKKAKDLKPDYYDANNNYIFALDLCENESVESLIKARKEWSDFFEKPLLEKHRPHTNKLTTDRKLKIGYLSSDFKLHSASFCFGSLLQYFDKDKFEVYAYNNLGVICDSRMQQFSESVTHWVDIYGKPNKELIIN